jgi:hypothetical protein
VQPTRSTREVLLFCDNDERLELGEAHG